MKFNAVKHIKYSPYHPSSKGPVEGLIQALKRSLKATQELAKSVDLRICEFLLTYRTTAHAIINELPSVLFMKTALRTRLDFLKPNTESVVHSKQAQQKKDHDMSTKQREFRAGNLAMVRNFLSGNLWLPATIIDCIAPLTYSVQLSDGGIWKCHIDHIRRREEVTKVLDSPEVSVIPETQSMKYHDWTYSFKPDITTENHSETVSR